MAEKRKFTLHYGGQEFDLPESQTDVLDNYRGEAGTVKMNLGNGSWLTIALGPGIPIALSERETRPTTVNRIR